MAALDGFREKADPIARKIQGTPDQQLATQTKRLEIREIMGTKNMREISLKIARRSPIDSHDCFHRRRHAITLTLI